jgi:hypothetical protein
MLKPPDPGEGPHEERPVGELVNQLVEDGKAYARAELSVAKAIANAKAKALVLPAGLFGAAFLLAQAAITVLAVGLFVALWSVMPALLAGLIAFLVFAGIAGGLGWYAIERLKRDL